MSTSPLDFPQVWQKPSFEALMSCLKDLRIEPPVWNLNTSRLDIEREQQRGEDSTANLRHQVSSYLSNIISSELAWIANEEQREELWSEASKRISERCGRSAMGEITRRWPLETNDSTSFELVIREPPLTGDSLGLKTWGSSYLLAQMLHRFIGGSSLGHLLPTADSGLGLSTHTALELGSGTGLLGLAAATIWRIPVVLTDLPSIVPNLRFNVEQNHSVVEAHGGNVTAGALTWGGANHEMETEFFKQKNRFKIILVADPLYDDDHPALLAGEIHAQLSLDADARMLVMVPKRDKTTIGLLSSFRAMMGSCASPLTCIEEGLIPGQDDWGEDDDTTPVECWWGIFRRW